MVIKMANPGKTANHQAEKSDLASLNILPQLTCSTGRPIPKNESVDSSKTVPAKPNDNATITVVNTCGSECLHIIM